MLIDYIYLLLIFVLIGSIIFFIYLSYEYRSNKEQGNETLENFVVPKINQLTQQNQNFTKNIGPFLDNYNNLIANAYNKQIINDSATYQNLVQQMSSNLNDSTILLKQQKNLKPIPETFPIDKLIKTIKSNYNSQYLSLFANDINKYGVLVNDKCMTVNGLCKDEFCLQNCQDSLYTSDSQKFYTNRIYSADDISRIMKIPKEKVNSKNVYPFNIFRSSVNDKCLSINNDGLSIENCNLNSIKQQWSISPNENICLLS